jgi:hypothetical protein
MAPRISGYSLSIFITTSLALPVYSFLLKLKYLKPLNINITYNIMPIYYTKNGNIIRNHSAYATTGAPMFDCNGNNKNISTDIYKTNCAHGKKYIGKTTDIQRRSNQHFSGNGSKVTKKFKPKSIEVIDTVPGYFSNDVEQYYTEENIEKYGYENVRGGSYTNSKTLHKTNKKENYLIYKSNNDDYEDDYEDDDGDY